MWAKVMKQLSSIGVTKDDMALLRSDSVATAQHGTYCNVSIKFFQEINHLPPQEAAFLMRDILQSR